MRVLQAGVVAHEDVVHHTLEGPAAPSASLVVVHGRWPTPLVPGELHLPSIGEGVPSCGIVGIPARIHALPKGELDVVVVGDGRAKLHLGAEGDRYTSGVQAPTPGGI